MDSRFLCVPAAVVFTICSYGFGIAKVICTDTKDSDLYTKIRPLGDLIASGEGDYGSVNRGKAGDTPGGLESITGKPHSATTIKEITDLQRNEIFAVGRYQFIPSTMQIALRYSCINNDDLFTQETQERLFAVLIFEKRPSVGGYIKGEHDDLNLAGRELAKEFAAVEYEGGRGFYDGLHGNKANITQDEVRSVLTDLRRSWNASEVKS